jgi:hypothetical protein
VRGRVRCLTFSAGIVHDTSRKIGTHYGPPVCVPEGDNNPPVFFISLPGVTSLTLWPYPDKQPANIYDLRGFVALLRLRTKCPLRSRYARHPSGNTTTHSLGPVSR